LHSRPISSDIIDRNLIVDCTAWDSQEERSFEVEGCVNEVFPVHLTLTCVVREICFEQICELECKLMRKV